MSTWDNPERDRLRTTVRAFAGRELLPHVDERAVGAAAGTPGHQG
ncbi:MAG: hypothetical protein SV966_11800 [Actinomycetota bacterium]|nr:hypothetical protein [Actinomycetota bacterium]